MKSVWKFLLRLFGWTVDITAPRRDKCVICVAPHTSNWDFPLGMAAYKSLGRKANFLMKESWFFFPLNYILKSMGGIPVPKKHGGALTEHLVEMFGERDYVNLAVTPEGTRSATNRWRTGFLYIAHGAGVPIQLGVIDYPNKRIIIRDEMWTTGDVETDMQAVKDYYRPYEKSGIYPDKFTL